VGVEDLNDQLPIRMLDDERRADPDIRGIADAAPPLQR
jgi:hypothetical protein